MAKIAINGFGRIGRQTLKRILEKYPDLDIVAINDLTDNKTLAHLLKYDSAYGSFEKEVIFTKDSISIDGKEIKTFSEKDPADLPWKKLGVEVVLECTGLFLDKEGAKKHITAGAKKVILSAPAKDDNTPGFVLGVNDDKYDNSIDIMDMGSCTTNCLAPVAKILNDNFKIQKGFMTTIHSYTNDQRILDLPHKDLRRARSAGVNLIPTSTGAAKSIGKIIPELDGKLDGIAVRVPTPVGSILDLVVEIESPTTKEAVNEVFLKAEKLPKFEGIFKTDNNELVSSDFVGEEYSSIIDLAQTMVSGSLVKVLAWYDNEWGYSCRLAQFADFIGKKL